MNSSRRLRILLGPKVTMRPQHSPWQRSPGKVCDEKRAYSTYVFSAATVDRRTFGKNRVPLPGNQAPRLVCAFGNGRWTLSQPLSIVENALRPSKPGKRLAFTAF